MKMGTLAYCCYSGYLYCYARYYDSPYLPPRLPSTSFIYDALLAFAGCLCSLVGCMGGMGFAHRSLSIFHCFIFDYTDDTHLNYFSF